MPISRKRKNHPYQKPADIPASQRVRGRTIWAILLAIFGVIIAFFAAGVNYVAMAVAAVIGATVFQPLGHPPIQQSSLSLMP